MDSDTVSSLLVLIGFYSPTGKINFKKPNIYLPAIVPQKRKRLPTAVSKTKVSIYKFLKCNICRVKKPEIYL